MEHHLQTGGVGRSSLRPSGAGGRLSLRPQILGGHSVAQHTPNAMHLPAAATNQSSMASSLAMMQAHQQLRAHADLEILAARRRATVINELRAIDAQREQEERMAMAVKQEVQRQMAQTEMIVKAKREREMILAREQQQQLRGVVAAPATVARNTSVPLAHRPLQQVPLPGSSLGSGPMSASVPALPRRQSVPPLARNWMLAPKVPTSSAGAAILDGEAATSRKQSASHVTSPSAGVQHHNPSPSGAPVISGSASGEPVPMGRHPPSMPLSEHQRKQQQSATAAARSPSAVPHVHATLPQTGTLSHPQPKIRATAAPLGEGRPPETFAIPSHTEAHNKYQAPQFVRKTEPPHHPSAASVPSTTTSACDKRYLELTQRALRDSKILPPPSASPVVALGARPSPTLAPIEEDCSVAVVSNCSFTSKPNADGSSSCMNSVSSSSSGLLVEEVRENPQQQQPPSGQKKSPASPLPIYNVPQSSSRTELKRPAGASAPPDKENKKAKRERTERQPEMVSLIEPPASSDNGAKQSEKSMPPHDKGNKILQLLEIAFMLGR